MAESLVGKIVGNAGKQWSRNTVADGNWLNSNTVQKFNENDKTLAEAIDSLSAEMEHFTPEITPSAWPCAANKTIQNIEQNADGSLNVTYQPIESSTTSDESLWSWYKQNAYDSVLAVYTETHNDINHEDGELSTSLTIPEGIYDVKIEVLYEPTQSTINNKLDIAISKSTNIDDALYQTFILFDDSLIKDTTSNPQKIDEQSQWITGIIDLAESTTLKFLVKGESAQGRYKLNNIYINSIGGAAGPIGPQGYTPSISTEIDTANSGTKVTFSWPAESQIQPTNFTIPSGTPGPAGPKGASGTSGFSPIITIDDTTTGQHTVSIQDATHTDSFTVLDGQNGINGISPTVSTEQITGGNRVTFTYDDGGTPATESIEVMSGTPGHTPVISMTSTDISRQSQGQTQNGTEVKFTVDGTDTTYSAWNGLDGAGSMSQVYTAGYVEGTGVDQQHAVQLTQKAVEAIEAVSGKVNNPNTSLTDKYLALRTNADGTVSGWTDILDKVYSSSAADNRYMQKTLDNTLSGDGTTNKPLGFKTTNMDDNKQYAFTTNGWDEIDDFVKKTGDTMTGPLVVNTTTDHPIVGISNDFAIFGATRKKSNNNFGTTWLGVGSDGQGVLKNIPNTSTSAATEPASNGAYTQITFSQNNNAVPSIDVNAKLNGSDHNYKSVVVPQQSYNNMSAFDATNGPNYMLRKLSDGSFDIGACVINVTDIPQNTEANTYYFVYDIV